MAARLDRDDVSLLGAAGRSEERKEEKEKKGDEKRGGSEHLETKGGTGGGGGSGGLDEDEAPRDTFASLDDEDEKAEDDDQRPVSLSDSLSFYCGKSKHSDVVFLVGPELREVYGHRMFLAARSTVFELMLFPQTPQQEKEFKTGDRMQIRVPDVRPFAFGVMLKCIYTGRADGITAENFSDILYVARKYGVDALRVACSEFLASGASVGNVCGLYQSDLLDEKERAAFTRYIEENAYKVMQTPGFLDLKESILIELLRRSSLVINEEELFDAVLEWGAAECKRRETHPDLYSIKLVLKNVLPLIRFPLMTIHEIANKVRPSGMLEEKDLFDLYMYLGHPKPGTIPCPAVFSSEPRVGRASFFKWEPTKKTASLTLFDDNRGAFSSSGIWQTVCSDTEWKEGIYEWELVLTTYSSTNGFNVISGLVPADYGPTHWNAGALIGYSNVPGWSLITGKGQIATASRGYSAIHYTSGFSQGDRVGHRLDLKKGTLEYFRNGRTCGIAFTDIRPPVRVAINMIDTQRVLLSFNKKGLRTF